MKGKVDFFVALPNLGRLRSRLENPGKELTSDIRTKLKEIIVDVVNKNSLSIQAELIDFVCKKDGVQFKTKEHQKQVENLFSGIFAVGAAVDRAGIDALCGDDEDDKAEGEVPEAPAEAPAEGAKPSKVAKAKAAKPAPAEIASAEDDEFSD